MFMFSCWKTDGTGILIAGLLIVNLYMCVLSLHREWYL